MVDPETRPEAPAVRNSAEQLTLDPRQILETVDVLRDRVDERFPQSGLSGLAHTLSRIAADTVPQLRWVATPHRPLRVGIGLLIAFIPALVGAVIWQAPRLSGGINTWAGLIQVIESVMNDVFFIGAAIFFLSTVETRIKRRRALRFLRELRALAHIVDMHQLTKDPDRVLRAGGDTPSSPERRMTPFELGRYLDYCSEMLSLISKIAALYVQTFDDAVVLAAVDEVETLTTGLSGKIWQKIMILERAAAAAEGRA